MYNWYINVSYILYHNISLNTSLKANFTKKQLRLEAVNKVYGEYLLYCLFCQLMLAKPLIFSIVIVSRPSPLIISIFLSSSKSIIVFPKILATLFKFCRLNIAFFSANSILSNPFMLPILMSKVSIASIFNTPFISFRIISDVPLNDNKAQMYFDFWDRMAEGSFEVTKSFIDAINK